MKKDINYEKIMQITVDKISNLLEIDKSVIKPESAMGDLGADSLDQVEILMEFEKAFNINMTQEFISYNLTIEEFCKHIKKMLLQNNNE